MGLFPKVGGKGKVSPAVVPKPSTSRRTKTTTGVAPTISKGVTRKPTLTKKGQGSFTVLGAPTTKVNFENYSSKSP